MIYININNINENDRTIKNKYIVCENIERLLPNVFHNSSPLLSCVY
jgi:hypothetical protein